ncbi:hypothetical protein [Marinomonas sp.]|uniref:hypothetical protein n=1 Tax=Marinomonas sp. TaxID=1904862 RepID=UPI003F9AB0D2
MGKFTVYVSSLKDAVDYYQSVFGLASDELDKALSEVVLSAQGANDASIHLMLMEDQTKESVAALNNAEPVIEWKTTQFWEDYHAFSAYGVLFESLPIEQAAHTSVLFIDAYGVNWKLTC